MPLYVDMHHLIELDSLIFETDLNPSNAEATFSKAQGRKDYGKPYQPCNVGGIHCKALTEYSQMSTHVPGFQ